MKSWVTPVLVLPGWFVEPITNLQTHEVRAMPETVLAAYIRDFPRRLSDEQIESIAAELDKKCRDVEF